MKKIIVFSLLIIVIAVTLSGCNFTPTAKYEQELLKGSNFEYESSIDLRADWDLAQGGDGTSSAITLLPENNGIVLNTSNTGWARVTQNVLLKSNSYYKVSYTYSSATMSDYSDTANYIGLFIGFIEDPNFNINDDESIEHTSSSTQRTITFYFKTARVKEANFGIFLGTEENPVRAANVTIFDISLERVKQATAEEDEDTVIFNLDTKTYGLPTIVNTPYVIWGGILIVVIIYVGFVLLRRIMALGDDKLYPGFLARFKNSKYFVLVATLSIALLVRLLFSIILSRLAHAKEVLYLGFEVENIIEQGFFMAKYGTTRMFEFLGDMPFLPLQFYLASFVGVFTNLISEGNEALALFFIKLLAILADLATVFLIFKVSTKKLSKMSSSIVCLIYSLIPATFALSSAYGNWASISAFLIALTFYFMLNKNLLGMGLAYLGALLMTTSALILAPVLILYLIYTIINDYKKWIGISIGIVVAFVVFYLVSMPFVYADITEGSAFNAFSRYIETIQANNYYTMNALNFQAMLGNNFREITTQSTFITVIFQALLLGVLAYATFKNKNRLDFFVMSTLYLALMVIFTNRMDQFTLYLIIPLTLMSGVLTKDKRLLLVASIYLIILYVNVTYMHLVLGYTEEGFVPIGDTPLLWIFGGLSVLAGFIHFFAVYDIVVTRQAYELVPMKTTYINRIKKILRVAGAKWQLMTNSVKGIFKK